MLELLTWYKERDNINTFLILNELTREMLTGMSKQYSRHCQANTFVVVVVLSNTTLYNYK